MTVLRTILNILYVLDCVALTVIVLMQEGKSEGLGALAGSNSDTYWGQNKARSKEGKMERFTRIAKLLAILVSLAYGYYFVSSVYLLAVGRMRLEALLPGLLLTAFVIGILFLSFRVIFSLRRDCSPFTLANARRLRGIGLLLIVYELLQSALSSVMTASRVSSLTT